mmetsp:Transcript_20127/g.28066  ORF Transcript_20127/g.28066 Transcript_20127/m.28066 type:complete len:205 (+) Transcript_20127:2137-2751(+)
MFKGAGSQRAGTIVSWIVTKFSGLSFSFFVQPPRSELIRFIFSKSHGALNLVPRKAVFIFLVLFRNFYPEQLSWIHFREKVSVEFSITDDHVIHLAFLVGFLQNVLFNRIPRDKTINIDFTSLSNTMTSVLCLQIHRWVPVRVIENYCISSSQIYSYSTRASRKNENEDLVVVIKAFHQPLSLLWLCCPIKSQVSITVYIQEVF